MSLILSYANEIVFILCGMLGGVAHYLKKYMRKETDVPVWDWFGKANLAATIYTFLVFLFAMIGSIASGVVNDDMSVWITMYVGFVTGFALDAGFNNDGAGRYGGGLNSGGLGGRFGGGMQPGGLPGQSYGGGRQLPRPGGVPPGGYPGQYDGLPNAQRDPELPVRVPGQRLPLTDLTPKREG